MYSWWLTSLLGEVKSVECSGSKGGRTSVMWRSRREEEFTQAPAPPLDALVTGHVRELQLLLAQFWNVVFWLIRRGFQQEVFFITERAVQDRARV